MRSAPTTDRGRASVERIVDAASLLFYAQGVRATGLDQIAAASGTGKGQIYHYFVDKSDLVLAVIERQLERVLESQEPLLSQVATWEQLDEWLALLVSAHGPRLNPIRCPLGSIVAELAEEDPAARDALARAFDVWQARIAAALERIQDAGRLDSTADCAALAAGVLAAYQGGLLLAELKDELAPLEAALATAREALAAHEVRGRRRR